ncbi:MAG: DUF3854 domain-containing protein [Nakamurella sp.]
MSGYSIAIFPQHARSLAASGITPEHASARGYVSVDTKKRLRDLNITPAGCSVPGLLIPQRAADGSVWGYQYRPDHPRDRGGKPVKYETPTGQRNGIDVPPGVGPALGDPAVPLWITEGVKKADAAPLAGLACVALPGVWSWISRNEHGGKVAVPDWRDIALNDRRVVLAFDSDVTSKPGVRRALGELAAYLQVKGAQVEFCHLPDDQPGKTGLDDYLAAGHTAPDLLALVHPDLPPEGVLAQRVPPVTVPSAPQPVPTATLADVHATFTRWLGSDYDLEALDAVLAAAAVEQLDGDPLWLLLVSGSGNAKTETVQALAGGGAVVTSTISSPGALLSATSKKETASDATGGLLRSMGARGVLVIKDITSILSMGREVRGEVLAALREVYDGRWTRNVGTDGGRTLDWTGRLVVVGAVTTAWDQAREVIASMGDRFVLVRMDSTVGRVIAGRRAIGNTGTEVTMRAELAAVVGGLLAGVHPGAGISMTEEETETLLAAADVVTLARTGVMHDYRGDVIDAHAPEMPTRFAKQLAQVVRGGVTVGMDRTAALRLAIRCARDSMPPLRLAIVDDLAANPHSPTREVRKRLGKPRATIDRELQALHILGVAAVDELESQHRGQDVTVWSYRLADGIDPAALNPDSVPDKSVPPLNLLERERETEIGVQAVHVSTDIPGTDFAGSRKECPACIEPHNPAHRFGLCGNDNAMHRDVERRLTESTGAA